METNNISKKRDWIKPEVLKHSKTITLASKVGGLETASNPCGGSGTCAG